MKFKEANSDFEKRFADSSRVRTKHKGKVPIICEKDTIASGNCPTCSKEKFLAQESLTCGKFIAAIQKQLNHAAELHIRVVHPDGFFAPANEQLVGEMDQQFCDQDGYLYVMYSDTRPAQLQEPIAPPQREPIAPEHRESRELQTVEDIAEAPAAANAGDRASDALDGVPHVVCVLVITAETWVWSMMDPHWTFAVDVMRANDESGVPVGSCTKRYSDFQELENLACAELGEKAWSQMPKLPSSHTIPGVGKLFDTSDVAQERRIELSAFLQDFLMVPGASETDAVVQFLELREMAQQHGQPITLESAHNYD